MCPGSEPIPYVQDWRMLERMGADVELASNGRASLEILQSGKFDAVLMDCHMPEMDGYEATRMIRAHEQGGLRTPVIALTANAMRGERERCLAAGMDDYLSKPIDAERLLEVLVKWIGGGRPVGPAAPNQEREVTRS